MALTDSQISQIIGGVIALATTTLGATIAVATGWWTEKRRQARKLNAIKIALMEDDGDHLAATLKAAREFFRENSELLDIPQNGQFYNSWLKDLGWRDRGMILIQSDLSLMKIQSGNLRAYSWPLKIPDAFPME